MLPLALSNGEVILLVAVLALPVAAIAFAGAGAVYREIGRGPFAMHRDSGAGDAEEPPHLREAELRQLLEGKAFRQSRRGEAPLDVERELRRLTAEQPPRRADPELVEEVRSLVIARNARRRRRGEPALDVEEETARRLAELERLGP